MSERGTVRIICGARYVKLRPGAAEIALTVHDDFQRRGLGAFLLKLLARLAQTEGLRWFEAEVLASNHKMLQLFKKVDLHLPSPPSDGGEGVAAASPLCASVSLWFNCRI